MTIYGYGHLDMGNPEKWKLLEELVLERFGELKKIDFDNTIAAFSTGSFPKGSTKLWKYFVAAISQNYSS